MALGDLRDPRVRSVLLKSICFSLVTALALWITLSWLLSSIVLIGEVPIIGGWLETTLDWLGSIAVFLLLVLLFPAFLGLYASLYIETTCRAVEERHYPQLQTPRNQSTMEAVIVGVKFGALLIAFNLFLLVFIVFPPIYLMLGWAVNGYLLGREYLELVGLRRMNPSKLRSYRFNNRGRTFMSGLILAVIASIPVANLILPLLGTAMMVHVLEGTRGPEDYFNNIQSDLS